MPAVGAGSLAIFAEGPQDPPPLSTGRQGKELDLQETMDAVQTHRPLSGPGGALEPHRVAPVARPPGEPEQVCGGQGHVRFPAPLRVEIGRL